MTDDLQAFYGRWARLYDRIARFPGVGAWRAAAADALALEPGDTVLEMGCGTGANLPYLRERVGPEGQVIGIDLTAGMLDVARERVERRGWKNVSLIRADASRPPIAASAVDHAIGEGTNGKGIDAVLASFLSGMFADPAPVIEEWCSLLGPGGRICLLDATRSADRRALPLDMTFRAFVVASTPPTWQLRYDDPPWRALEARVESAHDAVRRCCGTYGADRFALGFVRLTYGVVE
ncbi:alkanonic acid methyltransferase [Halobacteriales archaeon QS_3_64_16]|nr:MAG: alkanonic acid methyltransferase [Halobacteriales archaeon QS_3_64_16]